MFSLGSSFRCMEEPRHIFVPLFNPQVANDDLLLVNFTTLRDYSIDRDCILYPADYAELRHATTVAYSKSILGVRTKFFQAVTKRHFIQLPDLPTATLHKIICAAHLSEELSPQKKRVLPPCPNI